MVKSNRSYCRRILSTLLLFVLAIFSYGCFESDEDISLNPDGSGKMILTVVFDPSMMTLGQSGDSERATQDAVKKLLDKSQGIEVWKDVTFAPTKDGRVSFKGTAYFKDLSKVKIENFGTDFALTREGNVITVTMEDTKKKEAPQAATQQKQMTDAELNDAIAKAKGEWQRSKPMMAAMLSDLKKSATVRFRGQLVQINNFEKVSETAVRISFDGGRLIEKLDEMMTNDEWMRKQAMSGGLKEGGGPPEMDESFNEVLFGQPGPVMARVEVSSKPLFDYKKEVAAALKLYPKLQESLGIVPKLPVGSTIKDGVKFSLGEIKDQRTTGEFFGGLEVELVMSGDMLPRIRGLRKIDIATAVDDTGKNLLKKEELRVDPSRNEESSEMKQKVELENPVRAAATIRELSGSAIFYMPDKDPKASKVVVKGFMKQTGKPVVSDLLKKAKVDVAVLTKEQYEAAKASRESEEPPPATLGGAIMSVFGEMFSGFASVDENDVVFMIKDPGTRLVDLEVQDAAGKPLETRGRSTYSGTVTVISFEELPPADAQLVIYLETSLSLVQAPFSFTAVALP